MPFLNSDSKDKGYTDLKAAATVHVEPYGIYSDKLTSLDQVPDGGLVLLSNNVSNVARGLYLLQEAGLITLPYKYGDASSQALTITENDIVDNPKNLTFRQVEPAQIPRSLPGCRPRADQRQRRPRGRAHPEQGRPAAGEGRRQPLRQHPHRPRRPRRRPARAAAQRDPRGPEVAAFINKTYPGLGHPGRWRELTLFRTEELVKTFGDGPQRVEALKGITLDIPEGEVFGIVGHSGAGKSTLIRCLNLLERPTSGRVFLDDTELTGLRPVSSAVGGSGSA